MVAREALPASGNALVGAAGRRMTAGFSVSLHVLYAHRWLMFNRGEINFLQGCRHPGDALWCLRMRAQCKTEFIGQAFEEGS